jgi:hypothetical protein
MRLLITDRQKTRKMGRAARQEFEARFSSERFRSELGRFYRRAIEG